MKPLVLLLALGGACLLSAQMTISEVGPAASYIPTGLPGGGIAQGSYFYIKGTNLGQADGALFSGPANYTIGVDLAGTRVRVTIGATTLDAFPYYTSATQVNVILPSVTPVGSGTVTVLYNGAQVVFPITVVRAAYGIFTLNSAGSGPAVVTNGITNSVITYTNVLHPGDRGILWGTGLGAVSFPDNQPAQFQRLDSGVVMFIGGKAATIEYAGRTPSLSGLDQINFVVPQGVSGCVVPVVVRVGNAASNFTSVSVAATGSTCSDPGGLSANDLATAQAGGLSIGAIALSRTSFKSQFAGQSVDLKADLVSGSFTKYDANSFIRAGIGSTIPAGSCSVTLFKGQTAPANPVLPTLLDAGAKLTLNGPGGAKDVTKSNGLYSFSATSTEIPGLPVTGAFLDPGNYTVTGTGGADVGALSASLTLPAVLTWTNQGAAATIPRNQDYRVTWSGGAAGDQAIITGTSSDTASSTTGQFTCYENVSAGSFTIPSYVLSALPGSSVVQGIGAGSLSVGSFSSGNRFNATGINYGVITRLSIAASIVTFN